MDDTILKILKNTTLFHNMTQEEISCLCGCLGCTVRDYAPGAAIWLSGDVVERAGIVLEGAVVAEKISYGGTRSLAAQHGPAEIFGDILMSTGSAASPVDILAGPRGARIQFVPFSQIMYDCQERCLCHQTLRLNLLEEVSRKFWALRRHIECLSAPSLRGRLCLLLLNASDDAGADHFVLPFDRNGMAAYLGVNRSALSREISRLRDEGMLQYQKNRFYLPKKVEFLQYLD